MDYELNQFQDEYEELEIDNEQMFQEHHNTIANLQQLQSKVSAYEQDILTMRDMLNEKSSEIEYLNSVLMEKDEIIIHLESEKDLL